MVVAFCQERTLWSKLWLIDKVWLIDKETACNTGDSSLILGLRKFPGEENINPLQYPCLENPMDREAWQATVHEVAKGSDLA